MEYDCCKSVEQLLDVWQTNFFSANAFPTNEPGLGVLQYTTAGPVLVGT